MEIIRLKPFFKETIWGGDKLKKEFGYNIPSDNTGECWAVSAYPGAESHIVGGEYDGCTLSYLWDNSRSLFGNLEFDRFPIITKIIDANDDLSIQVHPDDNYASENENSQFGKSECWYILDCEKGSSIVVGHNAKTKEELNYLIDSESWDKLLNVIKVKKGQFFQIDPGTIHSINKGVLLLETQQCCDITYRLYDYNRNVNGKKRQLNLEKSKDVITVPFNSEVVYQKSMSDLNGLSLLISSKNYCVWKLSFNGNYSFDQDRNFMICSVIKGEFKLDNSYFKKGDHFIIPFDYGKVIMNGNAEVIMSAV